MHYCIHIKYVTVILILLTGNVFGQQKSYSYYKFPPLYNFDNYDACLKSKHEGSSPTYCMVYAEVKPNNASELLQQMINHSEEFPIHYSHDHLFFGVCVERCKKFSNVTVAHDQDYELRNEITDYFDKAHKRPLDLQFRKEYHTQIHNCLNFEFQRKYNLNLRTHIEYCEKSKDDIQNIEMSDYVDKLFYTLLGILLILNILSSLYDYHLLRQLPEDKQNNDFYKNNPSTIGSRLLTSFSIIRNYYRLIQPYRSDVGKDLKFLDCYRTFVMIFEIYGHTKLFLPYQHIYNPEFFEFSEENKSQFWDHSATIIIEIFFVMSGLFLFIKFQQMKLIGPQTSWKKFFMTFLLLLVFRYIRCLPTVGLLLFFNATVFNRLQDGPFWRHITEPIRTFSRDYPWHNLLFINNFTQKENANRHTWYVAADFQLYFVYSLALMIIAKYPKCKKYIYTFLAILSFFIRFFISYWFNLKPTCLVKPESYRYTFFKDMDVYYKVYTPFYTNLSGYLVGIICGEIYMKYTSTEKVRKFVNQSKVYLISYFGFLIAFIIFRLNTILEFSKPSLWIAVYSILHILVWDIFICAIPLLAMSCKCCGILFEFCCLPVFRILSRLAFQVYIWHATIIYLINGYQRQSYHVNGLHIFSQFLVVYISSYIVAFFIALFVEYPLAQCTELFIFKKPAKDAQKSS